MMKRGYFVFTSHQKHQGQDQEHQGHHQDHQDTIRIIFIKYTIRNIKDSIRNIKDIIRNVKNTTRNLRNTIRNFKDGIRNTEDIKNVKDTGTTRSDASLQESYFLRGRAMEESYEQCKLSQFSEKLFNQVGWMLKFCSRIFSDDL